MKSIPTIRLKTTIVHRVDARDLDEFIQLTTRVKDGNLNFSCCWNEGWYNHSQHTFAVDGKLNANDRQVWNNFKLGIIAPHIVSVILNGLCSQKLIPTGTYLIDVMW